jgi:hypothetical protein
MNNRRILTLALLVFILCCPPSSAVMEAQSLQEAPGVSWGSDILSWLAQHFFATATTAQPSPPVLPPHTDGGCAVDPNGCKP